MIDKSILNGDFYQVSFTCCKCNVGILLIEPTKSKVMIETSFPSADEVLEAHGMPDKYIRIKTELMQCSNIDCKLKVIMVLEERGEINSKNNVPWILEYDQYVVKTKIMYSDPPLKIIQIPNKTPKRIVEILNLSFSEYFIDHGSCVNKLRIAVEEILTFLKVRKQKLIERQKCGQTKRKIHKLNLNERITQLQKSGTKYSIFSQHFEAIRWIGNIGSHEHNKIRRERVIDAYEIIEYLLSEIYNNGNQRITKKAKEIILSKGK